MMAGSMAWQPGLAGLKNGVAEFHMGLDKMDSIGSVTVVNGFNTLHRLILCCPSLGCLGCLSCRLPPLFS